MELLKDGGAAAGSSRMASRKLRLGISSWGAGGYIVRARSTLGAGAGRLGAGRCHDSDAGRRSAHHFKFHSGRRLAREPGPREGGSAGAGSGGANEWAARGLTTLGSTRGQAGSQRCERRCGTHFLRSD